MFQTLMYLIMGEKTDPTLPYPSEYQTWKTSQFWTLFGLIVGFLVQYIFEKNRNNKNDLF